MARDANVCAATLAAMLLASAPHTLAQAAPQGGSGNATQIVQQAVNAELAAAKSDNTYWRYQKTEEGGSVYIEVDTAHGSIQRHIAENGHPASQATIQADNANIQKFIHDPNLQAKQRQNAAHDDKSAADLLNLMPHAFVWKVVEETPEEIHLSYAPDPNFSPPNMESRVMGGMTGTLVVDKQGHRIQTFKGSLEKDVTIGFGMLARIKAGSNFDIERKKVDATHWEIYATHVHVSGHALFFKTIGSQEDEVKTKWTRVPPNTTLEEAVHLLDEPLE